MHLKSLIYKFIFTTGILLVYLSFAVKTNITWNLIIAALVSVFSYLIGDLLILPAVGNLTAAVADVGLSAVIIWLIRYIIPGFEILFSHALYGGIALGIFELMFHVYMEKNIAHMT